MIINVRDFNQTISCRDFCSSICTADYAVCIQLRKLCLFFVFRSSYMYTKLLNNVYDSRNSSLLPPRFMSFELVVASYNSSLNVYVHVGELKLLIKYTLSEMKNECGLIAGSAISYNIASEIYHRATHIKLITDACIFFLLSNWQ